MEALHEISIPSDAAVYFPPARGLYEVKAGLSPFGTDMGNGAADGQVFQFDSGFDEYQQTKLQARSERLEKYYQSCKFTPELAAAVTRFIVDRLTQEHPERFVKEEVEDGILLRCAPSGETLLFDAKMQQVRCDTAQPPYASAFDALAMQVQEDLAVMRRDDSGENWLCEVHLCSANHWAAEDKIGRDFIAIHDPVPGMGRIKRPGMVTTMIEKGPFVRFSWGISTDTRLNHHPQSPPNVDPEAWGGRSFDPQNPRLYMRIERQVLYGFPEENGALFVIRTHFRDCDKIRRDPELGPKLAGAIESVTPESLDYKGLAESRDNILEWLRSV